jgi:hypothetical protein
VAFSTATITHVFQNGDGSAATGSVTFRLTKRMTNGTTTVLPTEITANLNPSGALSQALVANNDTGTVPGDAQWICTIRVAPAQVEEYAVTVPTGGGTIDLGTLLPQQPLGG